MYTLVPFHRNLNRELSNVFAPDHFLRSFFDMSDLVGQAGFRVDIREDEKAYQLEAELPGVPKDKLNVSVEEGTLTISADLNEEKKEEHGGYLYNERRSGHVERCFNLEGIEADNITAEYKNGVLMLNLPKVQPTPKKEPKKIEITGTENG
ncbi:MAG: Hsp20/alpha crystallin family protein [Clostridiales bacterium]|nr:Hsp20/alpha crystallin family protein [Clostridiales bacterium]